MRPIFGEREPRCAVSAEANTMTTMVAMVLATAVGAAPAARAVALTFDDLPAAGTKNPNEDTSLSSKDVQASVDGY